MRKQVLPLPLATAPFTFASARASGVTLDRLRRNDVVNVGRGLYRPADWDFDLEDAARVLSAASPGAWISHVTAARLRCQLLPPWLADSTELHLSKPRALPSVRRKGIFGHTVLALENEVEVVDGIRLSTRSRTWLDLAKVLPLHDLVSMGDELIRIPRVDFEGRTQPYDTPAGLRILVGRHPNLQGIVKAREALDLMRVGADSAPESLLRLAIVSADLPEPELQVLLRAGDARSPSADLAYRHRRLAIQYDGGHHLGDAQILSDRRRDKAFESAGWTVLVFDKDDLADDFQRAVQRIKRALRNGPLDHPQASGFASGE
ncbi:DUF559 domain-containing protein [Pseudarthrobacter sp. L1SW]|uniref:DUF559 domain-containing protein n=1 Tax=Pseudarthrobacter sp. L1SW TaxID=2851598 RepID=UPI001E510754|nr:DUF559 domain-containing protein [Pseudarthrobacter sp. L1SW]UEL28744.1 endonuclease domain-containing protein [Pseudarthrobacter sp. L1SW]